MKTSYLYIILVAIFFTGCGLSADNHSAQEVAEKFYTALSKGDATAAAALCGTDNVMTTQAWQELFEQNLNKMGNVTHFEKGTGFNVSKTNGVSTVSLIYHIDYQYGKSDDSIQLINKGEGFKLYNYAPEMLEAQFKMEMEKAMGLVSDYMKALSAKNYDAAYGFVGYSGTEKHTKQEWTDFFSMEDAQAGVIESFSINASDSKSYLNTEHSQAGHGNIYSVKLVTTRKGVDITEQVDLFQPAYREPLMIIADNVAM